MSLAVELTNPSAFTGLKIFSQIRKRDAATAEHAPPAAAIETREQLLERGAALVKRRAANGKVYEYPAWQVDGHTSLAEFVTKRLEAQEHASRQPSPATAPRPQKIVDEWNDPQPHGAIAPHGKTALTLHDNTRYVIESAEDVVLQFNNPHAHQTIRLRTSDKTGTVAHVAFIAPGSHGSVPAGPETAALIEAVPT